MKKTVKIITATFVISALTCSAWAQGSLTPPGVPGASMKTLDQLDAAIAHVSNSVAQVEARIDVATLSGNSTYEYIISQPGSYFLSGNLEVTKAAGISITVANVTLDLNGFEISRASGSGGNGITVFSVDGATVRNGTISGFSYGVYVYQSRGCLFESLKVSDCSTMGIHGGYSAAFVNCSALNISGSTGFYGSCSTMSGCTVSGSTCNRGFDAYSSIIKNCSVYDQTGESGIYAASGSVVLNCSVRGSELIRGIYGSGSVITDCSVNQVGSADGTANYGVYGVNGSVISKCSVSYMSNLEQTSPSQGCGIYASASQVRNCSTFSNQGDGVQASSDAVVVGNLCDNNGLNGDGAGIHALSSDNRIEGNQVTDNDRGIDVDISGNLIVRNSASGNTLNWDVAAGNVCLVVQAASAGAISGNSGGTAPGSTDPNANFTY